jgi:hypothetical protein
MQTEGLEKLQKIEGRQVLTNFEVLKLKSLQNYLLALAKHGLDGLSPMFVAQLKSKWVC